MSDDKATANDLFFAPGTEFDETELRRQAAETFIYETTEDLLVCMEDTGVSKAELARRTGMDPSRLSRVLGGEQNMTLRTLSDLYCALGLAPRVAFEGPAAAALVVDDDGAGAPEGEEPDGDEASWDDIEADVALAGANEAHGMAANGPRWITTLPDSPVDARVRARTDNVIKVDFLVDDTTTPVALRA